jgi:hypothetical protein
MPEALGRIGKTFRPGTDAIEFFHRQDGHDSIAQISGVRSIDDDFDDRLDLGFIRENLDFGVLAELITREEVRIFANPFDFGDA